MTMRQIAGWACLIFAGRTPWMSSLTRKRALLGRRTPALPGSVGGSFIGLDRNIARSCIDAGDWKSAGNTIDEGRKSDPGFHEGIKLQIFISKNL